MEILLTFGDIIYKRKGVLKMKNIDHKVKRIVNMISLKEYKSTTIETASGRTHVLSFNNVSDCNLFYWNFVEFWGSVGVERDSRLFQVKIQES